MNGNIDSNKNKGLFGNIESPTRKLIEEHEDRLETFDLNRIWYWNTNNIKKYKVFVRKDPRIENKGVLFNLMVVDKQIQDLQENHKIMQEIYLKQIHLTHMLQSMKV